MVSFQRLHPQCTNVKKIQGTNYVCMEIHMGTDSYACATRGGGACTGDFPRKIGASGQVDLEDR